jgi:hypothetical protein
MRLIKWFKRKWRKTTRKEQYFAGRGCSRLEPDDVRMSCPVLRGLGIVICPGYPVGFT